MTRANIDARPKPPLPSWQPIETAPNEWLKQNGKCLIGSAYYPKDEDGEPCGEPEWGWVQVATLSFDGWHVGTGGFKGLHGYASFQLAEHATHWMPLPTPPEPSA